MEVVLNHPTPAIAFVSDGTTDGHAENRVNRESAGNVSLRSENL